MAAVAGKTESRTARFSSLLKFAYGLSDFAV